MAAVIAFIVAAFEAFKDVKIIGGYIKDIASALTSWYINSQTEDTKSQIYDAMALSMRAKNDEERFAAGRAWQAALNRHRIKP